MRFVDTDILLYAAGTDPREQAKSRAALSLLEQNDLALSVQVLQEFYVQSTRPTKSGRLTHEQAVQLIEAFRRFPVQEMTAGIMEAALAGVKRFRISYWDAAILETARTIDCRVVFSEDLNDGQDYDGVRIVNPFRKLRL